jgi:hypothetical protein
MRLFLWCLIQYWVVEEWLHSVLALVPVPMLMLGLGLVAYELGSCGSVFELRRGHRVWFIRRIDGWKYVGGGGNACPYSWLGRLGGGEPSCG